MVAMEEVEARVKEQLIAESSSATSNIGRGLDLVVGVIAVVMATVVFVVVVFVLEARVKEQLIAESSPAACACQASVGD